MTLQLRVNHPKGVLDVSLLPREGSRNLTDLLIDLKLLLKDKLKLSPLDMRISFPAQVDLLPWPLEAHLTLRTRKTDWSLTVVGANEVKKRYTTV